MNEAELKKILNKATKNELIYAVMAMRSFWCSSISIPELVYAKRLDDIQKKIDKNLKEGSRLAEQLRKFPVQKKSFGNSDFLELVEKISKNQEQWMKLNAEYDKAEKLAFPKV